MEACALRTEIMGVGFDDLTLDEAAGAAAGMIEEGGFHYVVTPNPELVDRARREEPFRQASTGRPGAARRHRVVSPPPSSWAAR